jgi:glutamine---fructose-6-phosphate transaminase (isomerizing)
MTDKENRYADSHTWNEIQSQPTVWRSVITEISESSLIGTILEESTSRREWIFIGCGTSFYLAECAATSWTLLTGLPTRAIPASEVLLYPKLLQAEGGHIQAVVISRSGHTSEAVRAAKVLRDNLRIPTMGITCAQSSELEGACDRTLVLPAADEQSTVMSRSFTSMLLALQVLGARRAGTKQFIGDLSAMSEVLESSMQSVVAKIEEFAAKHTFADYIFLGQGPFHGIAREAALKVMEMSCSYSQFFHALEFRHGPKAIVSPATCLTFFLSDTAQKAEVEVLSEMKGLGGVIIAICNRANAEIRKSSDLVIEINAGDRELTLLAPYIVPCQLLGFFTGLGKGLNPDQPKNLTRVVVLD